MIDSTILRTIQINCMNINMAIMTPFFFYKFCPNLLMGRIHKDRATAKRSLLR